MIDSVINREMQNLPTLVGILLQTALVAATWGLFRVAKKGLPDYKRAVKTLRDSKIRIVASDACRRFPIIDASPDPEPLQARRDVTVVGNVMKVSPQSVHERDDTGPFLVHGNHPVAGYRP